MPREVRIASQAVGGAAVPVIAGPGAGGEVARYALRGHDGHRPARHALADARARWPGPLLVEPFPATDLAEDLGAVSAYADGVLVDAASTRDFRLLRAVGRLGLPMVVERDPHVTLDDWLTAAGICAAEGNRAVILCESGDRTRASGARRVPDLAILGALRQRADLPVLVGVSPGTGFVEAVSAAVAAGADGLLLAEDTPSEDVALAVEAATTLSPLVRPAEPDTLAGARAAIDRVDASIATLLERRAALAGRVQRLKPVGGFAGRDPVRERAVVAAMARRAPRLGSARLERIMAAVIEAGLDLAESESTDPPAGEPSGASSGGSVVRSEPPRGVAGPAVTPAG